MRNTFSKTIEELAKKNKNIVLLVGDIGFSVFESFKEQFPERFFNVGISEQNMMGMAAGLAVGGKKVFVYSIIPFVTLRCLEQIRNDICYQDLDVVIVGVGSGVSYGSAGFSHHATEDIGCLKVIPNLTILTPSDPMELKQLVIQCLDYKHPVYLRVGKTNEKTFNLSKKIEIGKAYYIKKEKDIALITHGNIIGEVVTAYNKLKRQGLDVSVISVPTIKPLDEEFFNELFKTHNYIFIIEEHNKIGGLGDSIFQMNKNNLEGNIFNHISINDEFIFESGNSDYLKAKKGLNSDSIYKGIIKAVLQK